MDPIDILGELLGRKSKKPGRDGSVFDDMFGKGTSSQRSTPGPSSTGDIDAQAKELEDLLNVAKQQRSQAHPTSAGAQSGGPAEYPWAEASGPQSGLPGRSPTRRPSGFPTPAPRPTTSTSSAPSTRSSGRSPGARPAPPRDPNEQAIVLIRAMVNAAKADGEISPQEQQALLAQIGDSSPAALEFLRQEIARPLDVREFAWSVPLGLEQKVYALSLAAMRVDTEAEVNYLLDLSHGLRIAPELRRQLHDHYHVPQL